MSVLERALNAARKRGDDGDDGDKRASKNGGIRGRSTGRGWQGILSSLIAKLDPSTMERSNILPAVEDQEAITAYKMLRTRVLQRMRSHQWQSLVVTGAGPGEGKTTTACNLAVSVANDVNQSVVLVDLDLQKPRLAEYFGLEAEHGVSDYLQGEADIEQIVYTPEGLERIVIIPNMKPVSNSSELLASPRMRDLVAWIREQGPQTVALFDMPPVLACDDVLAFSPEADAFLIVVSDGITDRTALTRMMEIIADREIAGIVLNRSRDRNPVYGYGYG